MYAGNSIYICIINTTFKRAKLALLDVIPDKKVEANVF